MLKTPEVKDVSVKEAAQPMTKIDTGKTTGKFLASGAAGGASLQGDKASNSFLASGAAGGARLPSQVRKEKPGMLSTPQQQQQTFAARAPISPVSKATSAVQDTVSGVIDSVKNNKAIQLASTALGFITNPVFAGAKMVAGMLPEETNIQKMNKGYFNTNEGSQRISGNPATDLYAGMNRNSAFGNLENAGNKRISTREKTAAKKGYTKDNDPTGFVSKTEKMKNDAKDYKAQKTTTQKATQGPAGGATTGGGGGGGGGGSDSGRVICTDLHRTGELSTKDWVRDTKFTFKTLSKTHVKGYLLWAEPTVKHMQKYPRYRKMWKHIAQHRANDIAWRLNEGKFDLLGRIYAGIGEPVCWALGNFVSDKQISKYNLTHWRRA